MQTVSYTRGNDLSGPLEGAGGIGGMLARSHGYSGSTGNWSTHNYYHADAGGNITCLISSNNGITAIYRYDPFGRTLFQSGTMANANVYRFSSKEVHGFTGMYYYGFRFYDPGLQRWINRDPIGEMGGLNLYGFVGNNPHQFVDPFGLTDTSIHACARNNPGAVGNLARELLRETAKDQARRRTQQEAIKQALNQLKASPKKARRALNKALGSGPGQAHHIVPHALNNHPLVVRAAQGGFNVNSRMNGIRLNNTHKGFNEWHRRYNEGMKNLLDDLYNHNNNIPKDQAANLMQRLADMLKGELAPLCPVP